MHRAPLAVECRTVFEECRRRQGAVPAEMSSDPGVRKGSPLRRAGVSKVRLHLAVDRRGVLTPEVRDRGQIDPILGDVAVPVPTISSRGLA